MLLSITQSGNKGKITWFLWPWPPTMRHMQLFYEAGRVLNLDNGPPSSPTFLSKKLQERFITIHTGLFVFLLCEMKCTWSSLQSLHLIWCPARAKNSSNDVVFKEFTILAMGLGFQSCKSNIFSPGCTVHVEKLIYHSRFVIRKRCQMYHHWNVSRNVLCSHHIRASIFTDGFNASGSVSDAIALA